MITKYKIGFIIRFHYEKEDPRFEWRLKYFISDVLPRIRKQSVINFDICIRCNEWHREIFEKLRLKTFKVVDEYVAYKGNVTNTKKFFYDFISWDRVVGLDKYDIQVGLDSDDLIEKKYLEKALEKIEKYDNGKKSIHICFQPKFYYLKDKTSRPFPKYTENVGSAFMVLYQPDKENYRFIYEESHLSIIKKADIKVVMPVGDCMATCHEFNESTGK